MFLSHQFRKLDRPIFGKKAAAASRRKISGVPFFKNLQFLDPPQRKLVEE